MALISKKIQNKDTHTLCPINPNDLSLPLKAGTKVKVNGKEYSVKSSTQYMAFFNEKFELPGASKNTPKEITVEFEG